jgi:hypothetical protein
MASAVLFLCPQCGLGRQLAAYAIDARIRCHSCETSFRSDGYLFDAAEWTQPTDPHLLASIAIGMDCGLSARKWRLLACAIGRSVFDWCRNPWFRDALQDAERWADEGAAPRSVKACRNYLEHVELPPILRGLIPEYWHGDRQHFDYQVQQEREQFAWVRLAQRCLHVDPQLQSSDITERNRPHAANLLRDLIPNPFIPLEWNHDWFTSTVRELAGHIYVRREFSTMPILADALQDAGCEDEQILSHCRAEKPHARGCWVLDAILGKS